MDVLRVSDHFVVSVVSIDPGFFCVLVGKVIYELSLEAV